MKERFKIFVFITIRFLFHGFWIFPVKRNRIFFSSHNGRQFSCNPKYLFLHLYSHYGNRLEYVWEINNPEQGKYLNEYENVKIIQKRSFEYFFYLLTAKVFIMNVSICFYTPFRRSQLVINTWHGGGAYKRVGRMNIHVKEFQCYSLNMTNKKYLTHIISSCDRFTEIMSYSYFIPREKFLQTGMPRNDIFFHNYESTRNSTRERLSISRETGVLLYAPTYRDYSCEGLMTYLDIPAALGELSDRFNKTFVCLTRGHHCMSEVPNIENVVNVTAYPDMQELLCAADVLITDYSSSIWDFSFTGKPCFIYAPDLKKYETERGFYTPIEEWPFIVAETNGELLTNISNFDREKHLKAIAKHHADLGSFDNGTASKMVCKIIESAISI